MSERLILTDRKNNIQTVPQWRIFEEGFLRLRHYTDPELFFNRFIQRLSLGIYANAI